MWFIVSLCQRAVNVLKALLNYLLYALHIRTLRVCVCVFWFTLCVRAYTWCAFISRKWCWSISKSYSNWFGNILPLYVCTEIGIYLEISCSTWTFIHHGCVSSHARLSSATQHTAPNILSSILSVSLLSIFFLFNIRLTNLRINNFFMNIYIDLENPKP